MAAAEVFQGVEISSPLAGVAGTGPITGVEYDSRRIQPGNLFFAFEGANADGRSFARQAMELGAVAVVSELPAPDEFEGPWIRVPHGRRALALAARNLYGEALASIHLTGITGTNGKTTVAYLTDSVFRAAGKTTALIGTIEYQLAGRPLRSVNTTPESVDLYRIFDELARLGGSHASMEVSSHALDLGRVHGVEFRTAIWTNLSRDHLDYHQTMDAYFQAKHLLFDGRDTSPPSTAVLNRDDEWARRIRLAAATRTIWYGAKAGAELAASDVETGFAGLRFRATWEGRAYEIQSPMLGRINVSNILAAFGAGVAAGISPEKIVEGIANCRAVPGRFEKIEQGQPFLVIVDYAHTDDALKNVIAAARALKPKRVITLFGCGGDRDRAKRPIMGQAAGVASDYVVLTSDNPRSEDPVRIINDALVGLRRQDVPHKVEPDRETAIRLALEEAMPGDAVLITGKGHETYQVIGGQSIPFDDREVSRRLLTEFGYGGVEG
ncbi:MAG: UDP-N-acetylmuramoyl-L-alanyl-D-glutamate--2,6-diaminopimelate ligase [bacterium]|nr:UDP-N-acetylmuramoyl-L-alanyl-D-glutamate--2,6-diaminopimelate ligase [bacterium]